MVYSFVSNQNPGSRYLSFRQLIVLPVLLLLLGCSNKTDEYELTYWCATNNFEIEFAKMIVEEWNQDSTRIPVRFQPIPAGQSSEEVMLAAIVAKTTPDVYSNIWPGVIEQYREAGVVLNLNQFADFDSVLSSRLPPEIIAGFRSPDGYYYQLPWKGNPLMMVYNAGMLRELGIDKLPRTYSDMKEIAPLIAVDFNGDSHPDRWVLNPNILTEWWQRFFDFYTFSIAASNGRTLISDGKAQLNRAEITGVMEFFRWNYARGYFPRSIFQGDIFLTGQLAFHVTGPWMISYIEKYKTPDFEYGMTPIPVPDDHTGPVHTYGDPKSIVIFSNTRYPQKAWEFVKFMTTRSNDFRLLKTTSQIPLRHDLTSDSLFAPLFDSNPHLRVFAEQIPNLVGTDHTIYLQEIFDIISQEFDAACIHDAKPVDEAIESLQSRISILLEREGLAEKFVKTP